MALSILYVVMCSELNTKSNYSKFLERMGEEGDQTHSNLSQHYMSTTRSRPDYSPDFRQIFSGGEGHATEGHGPGEWDWEEEELQPAADCRTHLQAETLGDWDVESKALFRRVTELPPFWPRGIIRGHCPGSSYGYKHWGSPPISVLREIELCLLDTFGKKKIKQSGKPNRQHI